MFPFRVKKKRGMTGVNETVSDKTAVCEQDVKGDTGRRRETSFFCRRFRGWAAEEVA